MTNFPNSKQSIVEYSELTWESEKEMYKYTETVTHFCTEEALAEYKQSNLNIKLAEETRDSSLVINTAQGEIDWVEAAESTK